MRIVFLTEIKRILSYRIDFWLQFVAGVLIQIGLAFFLWQALFERRGGVEIGGYGFRGLMFYYLMVPLVDRAIRGPEMSFIAPEIYEGTLSKYLIYPVPFFLYKFVTHFAQSFAFLFQFLLTLTVSLLIFGNPPEFRIGVGSMMMGIGAMASATVLYFSLSSIFECFAFWADNVWSLLVMLRLVIFFLGGGMVPLSMFPEGMVHILDYTPFPYLTSFPIRCLVGEIAMGEFLAGILKIVVWSALFAVIVRRFWRRGLLVYTGVGI
jgi:ABC-2 type transport system permease protein